MVGKRKVKQDIFTEKMGRRPPKRDIFVKIWVMSTQMGHFYKKLGRRLLRQDIFTKKMGRRPLKQGIFTKKGQTSALTRHIWVMSTQMGHFYKKLGRRLLRQDIFTKKMGRRPLKQDIFTKKWADIRLDGIFLWKFGQTSACAGQQITNMPCFIIREPKVVHL